MFRRSLVTPGFQGKRGGYPRVKIAATPRGPVPCGGRAAQKGTYEPTSPLGPRARYPDPPTHPHQYVLYPHKRVAQAISRQSTLLLLQLHSQSIGAKTRTSTSTLPCQTPTRGSCTQRRRLAPSTPHQKHALFSLALRPITRPVRPYGRPPGIRVLLHALWPESPCPSAIPPACLHCCRFGSRLPRCAAWVFACRSGPFSVDHGSLAHPAAAERCRVEEKTMSLGR